MTYLPTNIFKNIISYCGYEEIERRQRFRYGQVLTTIKTINTNLQDLDNYYDNNNYDWPEMLNDQITNLHNEKIFVSNYSYNEDGLISFIYNRYV